MGLNYNKQEIKKFLLSEGFQEDDWRKILNHRDETERDMMLLQLDSCICSVDASHRIVGEDGQRFPLQSFRDHVEIFLKKINNQRNEEEPKTEEEEKPKTEEEEKPKTEEEEKPKTEEEEKPKTEEEEKPKTEEEEKPKTEEEEKPKTEEEEKPKTEEEENPKTEEEEKPKTETIPRRSLERFIVETAFTVWCGFIGFVIGTIILPGHGSVFGAGLFIFLSHQIRLKNR